MMKYLRKFISLILIFAFLTNTVSITFAQEISYDNYNAIKDLEIKSMAYAFQKELEEENAKKDAQNAYMQQTQKEDQKTALIRYRLKNSFKNEQEYFKIIESFNSQLKENTLQLNTENAVCFGGVCQSYKIFMKALISALLDYRIKGNGALLIDYTRYLQEPVFLGAISLADKRHLFQLIKEGVKQKISICDGKNNSQTEQRCEDVLAGLTILSAIWETENDAKEIADLTYNILKEHYTDTYGIMVLMHAIASLSFIDTNYSYELIEKFLTQDTAPSLIGNKTRDFLSMFSFTGEYEMWTEYLNNFIQEGGHYLNRYNERWQYIKEEEVTKQTPALDEKQNKVLDLNNDSIFASYNVVYDNILTDIGEFLSSQEGRGKYLAKKIVRQYVAANEGEVKTIHTPLILGLIQNLDSYDASLAAERIQNTFYYDLNGGTATYVKEKSKVNGKYDFKLPLNVRSIKDYADFVHTKRITLFGDILIVFVSFISLARQIPHIISKIKNLANILKMRKMAHYGNAVVVENTAKVTKPSIRALAEHNVAEIPAPKTTPKALIANTSNTLSKIRKSAQASQKIRPELKEKLAVSFTSNPNYTPNLSQVNKAGLGALSNSVFMLENPMGQFTGYIAEVPIYGVNKQVIITAGHPFVEAATSPVRVFDNFGNHIVNARPLFFDFNYSENLTYYTDYALLIPDKNIPFARPLDLSFNGSIYDNKSVKSIGFPDGKWEIKDYTLAPYMADLYSVKDIAYLQGLDVIGESGSPVLAEISPNKFSCFGTISGNCEPQEGQVGPKVSITQGLGWLNTFIHGQPFRSNFRFPLFPPISFIKSNPKIIHSFQNPIDISGSIVKKGSNDIAFQTTSAPLNRPNLQLTSRTSNGVWFEQDPKIIGKFLTTSAFANNPITENEWETVETIVQEINEKGFAFDDLKKSIFLSRNHQGEIVVEFTELKESAFEVDNSLQLYNIKNYLEDIGIKIGKSGTIRKPQVMPKLDPTILTNVNSADLVVTETSEQVITHAVWRLKDNNGKVVGYLKYGTEDELINMEKLHKIISENNLLNKFDAIKIKYQQLLTENPENYLPKKVLDEVYEKYGKIEKLVRNPSLRAKVMFVTVPMEGGTFCWGNLGNDEISIKSAMARIHYKPITAKEWEQLYNFFVELEKHNFQYDDVYNNLELGRDNEEILNVKLTDFETEGGPHDMLNKIKELGNTFNSNGIKEPNPYIDAVDLPYDDSFFFPF